MNGGKLALLLVTQPEIAIGSLLPLASFDVTLPGLAAVKVDMF